MGQKQKVLELEEKGELEKEIGLLIETTLRLENELEFAIKNKKS